MDPQNWGWHEIIQLSEEQTDVTKLVDAIRQLLKFSERHFYFQRMKKSADLHRTCRGDAILRNIYDQQKRKMIASHPSVIDMVLWENFQELLEVEYCGLAHVKSQISYTDALICQELLKVQAKNSGKKTPRKKDKEKLREKTREDPRTFQESITPSQTMPPSDQSQYVCIDEAPPKPDAGVGPSLEMTAQVRGNPGKLRPLTTGDPN